MMCAVAQGLLAVAAHSSSQTRAGYYRFPRMANGDIDHPALLDLARTRVMITIALNTIAAPRVK